MFTKTPFAKSAIKEIAEITNQLWYFMFSSEEFTSKLGNYSSAALQLSTPDLFAQNKYSSRIDVKAAKISAFAHRMEKEILNTFFSAAYEVASIYISDIIELLKSSGCVAFKEEKKGGPEETLQKSLAKSGMPQINGLDEATFTYMRYRRNHLVHKAGAISQNLKTFLGNKGSALATHWGPAAKELDFTSTKIFEFQLRECIDCLQILKLVINNIDGRISTQLDKVKISDSTAKELFHGKSERMNEVTIAKRCKSLSNTISTSYGTKLPPESLRSHATSYGTR